MTLYNPIGRPVKHWVHIPVTGSAYTVLGPNGETIQTQVGLKTYQIKYLTLYMRFLIDHIVLCMVLLLVPSLYANIVAV